MFWVIMQPGPPPLYIKSGAASGVTYRAAEAERFASEYEATMKLLQLNLPRNWFVVSRG